MCLKKLITMVWLFALIVAGCTSVKPDFSIRPGDLLFRDSECGPLCDAIEKVTAGYKGANLSHVGIAAKDANGGIIVLEAVSKGVVATDLQSFIYRGTEPNSQPKVMVGRLKKTYRRL